MNFKRYIQQSIASTLLLVFLLAATPKRVLHNLFADHTDVAWTKSANANEVNLNSASYQCQIDQLVVELPFFGTALILFPTPLIHTNSYQESYSLLVSINKLFTEQLRGPPIHC